MHVNVARAFAQSYLGNVAAVASPTRTPGQCQYVSPTKPAGQLQLKVVTPSGTWDVWLPNARGPGFAICASAEAVTSEESGELERRRACGDRGEKLEAVKAFSKSMTVVKSYDNWSCPRSVVRQSVCVCHHKMHFIFYTKRLGAAWQLRIAKE